jgi:hypothetical protein
MKILPYIVICFLSASAANANELNQYLEQYNSNAGNFWQGLI